MDNDWKFLIKVFNWRIENIYCGGPNGFPNTKLFTSFLFFIMGDLKRNQNSETGKKIVVMIFWYSKNILFKNIAFQGNMYFKCKLMRLSKLLSTALICLK